MTAKPVRKLKDDEAFFPRFMHKVAFAYGCAGLLFHLVSYIDGDVLSVRVLVYNAVWIMFAVAGLKLVKKAREGVRLTFYDFLLQYILSLIIIFTRSSYPLNAVLAVLAVTGTVIVYKQYDRWTLMQESSRRIAQDEDGGT